MVQYTPPAVLSFALDAGAHALEDTLDLRDCGLTHSFEGYFRCLSWVFLHQSCDGVVFYCLIRMAFYCSAVGSLYAQHLRTLSPMSSITLLIQLKGENASWNRIPPEGCKHPISTLPIPCDDGQPQTDCDMCQNPHNHQHQT